MKQTKLYLSIFLLLSVFLFSCSEKSNDIKPVQEAKYTLDELLKISNNKYEPVYASYTLVFDIYGPGTADCWPPATDCIGDVVASGKKSGLKSDNFDPKKFKLYNTFKNLYNSNSTLLFFKNEDWSTLFTGITDFCAKEIAEGNLKLIMKASSTVSNAEIYLIVENNTNAENWTKGDVIGAIQIILE